MRRYLLAALCAGALSQMAHATPVTETSPTGGPLPAGVTKVGGVVVDLKGTNGTRVVSQVAASSLYKGYSDSNENPQPGNASGNPLLIGTQTGFTQALISSFGGGLASADVRITLFDGDTAPGTFDFNDNTFSVNNVSFGNFSTISTSETNENGTLELSTGLGFGNEILSTGFFSLTDPTSLGTLYASLGSGSLQFRLIDSTPADNFYDFTRGVSADLIDVGQGPVVAPPVMGAVPEPSTWAMMLLGFGVVGYSARRGTKRQTRKPQLQLA